MNKLIHKNYEHCVYCGIYLKLQDRTKDHVLAKSKGGTKKGNIATSCKWCNQTKASYSSIFFRKFLKHVRRNTNSFPIRKPTGESLGNLFKSYFKLYGYPDPVTAFFYEYGSVNKETGETLKEFREKVRNLPAFKNYSL